MIKSDAIVAQGVCVEYLKGTGAITAQRVAKLVADLVKAHGDNFTLDGAIDALKRLSEDALWLKQALEIAKKHSQ